MFGISNKEKEKSAKVVVKTEKELIKIFMTKTALEMDRQSLNSMRAYFINLADMINNVFINGQKIRHTVNLEVSNNTTWKQALDFTRYDFTVRMLRDLCENYGYTIWIKEKAGRIVICISDDKEYVIQFAEQFRESYEN